MKNKLLLVAVTVAAIAGCQTAPSEPKSVPVSSPPSTMMSTKPPLTACDRLEARNKERQLLREECKAGADESTCLKVLRKVHQSTFDDAAVRAECVSETDRTLTPSSGPEQLRK